ncbi:phage tail tip protein [Escherichia coli]|uniref:phage tail tip domain-containing protein n=1 Tax=Escherichia coli TaxID=562 RepID=UPI003D35E5F4
MQRKTLLSACIALALSGQGWAADITEIETTTGEKKNTNVTCPADPGKLSPEELKRLPSECSSVVEQNLMPWLVTGAATALITTLAIVELNDDDDHHRNNSPLPPTPPDDDSDDTPVPPTPGGDEIIPDDGPDDTPTPPKPISFNNDVILDKTEKTLTIRDSVFTYTENADGTISLQDSNGRKATINLWQIDETNNTVALEGMSADGATKWQYNHNGELVITGDNTTVNNTGKTIVDGKGATGTEIAGNNAVVNQDGELDVSGGGHGIDITGDSATVDNKGGMTVTDPDSIGIQIDGDKAVVNNDGDSAISNGGTGTQVNGDEATVNNNGKTTVDGKDSTGTEINGDKAIVNNDGDRAQELWTQIDNGQLAPDLAEIRTSITDVSNEITQTVNKKLENQSAAIQQIQKVQVDTNNNLNSMWAVKLQQMQDGRLYIAGIGAGIENTPAGMQSQVLLAADRIAMINPANGNTKPMFVGQGDQIFMNDVFLKRLTAPTITSGGNPPAFSLTPDGKLTAKNADISGSVNANAGTLNNVTINENCQIKGKLSANQIEGDIVKTVGKAFPRDSRAPERWPSGTITVRIYDDQPFDRQIVIPAVAFSGAKHERENNDIYSSCRLIVRKNGAEIYNRTALDNTLIYSGVIDMPAGRGHMTLEFSVSAWLVNNWYPTASISDLLVVVMKKATAGISIS